MDVYKTPQEAFWAGQFGNEYIKRNCDEKLFTANLAFFSRIFRCTGELRSIVEFGANIGLNISALQLLFPRCDFTAVEINYEAYRELSAIENIKTFNQSLLDFSMDEPADLAFTKTVMIHIAPEKLNLAYDVLYASSRKYVLIAEYYNPVPIAISYRGHEDKLFKRDFAGEMLDRYPDLRLIDYGFVYQRDPLFPQDDITWFLLEKRPFSSIECGNV